MIPVANMSKQMMHVPLMRHRTGMLCRGLTVKQESVISEWHVGRGLYFGNKGRNFST